MKYRKQVCLLLALVTALCCCACGAGESQSPATQPLQTEPLPTVSFPETKVDNPVTYFSVSMGQTYDTLRYINAYPDESGNAFVEYVGDEKKVGTVDAMLFHGLVAELESSGISAFDGENHYADGEAAASMYIEFADGSRLAAGYSGSIPEDYASAYAKLELYFRAVTAQMPVYVPQPVVMGEVDPQSLEEMRKILELSGMAQPDSLAISAVPKDDYFLFTLGLTGQWDLELATQCNPMMTASAYSMVMVQLNDESQADGIRKDFMANLNWSKWVCVSASDALVARKGDYMLCLMGSGDMYTQTVSGLEAAGWTILETAENPAM